VSWQVVRFLDEKGCDIISGKDDVRAHRRRNE